MRATWPDSDNTTAVGATTGLAACNVIGMTTYKPFQLPVEHEGKWFPEISENTTLSIYC